MKNAAKTVFRWAAIVAVSPLIVTHAICSACSDRDASLESHSQLLSLLPGKLGSYLRVGFYRFVLEHCDPSATICFGVLFSKSDACIHANAYVGPRCMLGWVTLEDDVLLGPNVQIPSGANIHGFDRLDVPIRDQPGSPQRITIGRDSWIGGGATVLADVAPQCVVGAGSIVTKPTSPGMIVVGNPARPIAKRGAATSLPGPQGSSSPATQADEVCANRP